MTTDRPPEEVESFAMPPNTGTESIRVRALVSELIAGSPPGAPLDAQGVLHGHPELANHKSALMELAYEDFCRRDDLGVKVDPEEFAACFPTIYRSLLHQIGVHQLLADGLAGEVSTADRAWPAPATAWLDYELLEELGRGAFSRVYLARERTLGRRLVVVKATPLGPREAQTLGMLQHPHVVPVHSVQRDAELGLTAVCMPYLSRVSLFDVMDAMFAGPEQDESKGAIRSKGSKSDTVGGGVAFRRPPERAAVLLEAVQRLNSVTVAAPEASADMSWPRHWRYADAVVQIGVQLAQALEHAHRQRVLHGDVKPSNVLITNSGRAVLLDFNLAIFGDDSAPFIAGTLPYMAPEQLRPLAIRGAPLETSPDERTDIFSLGSTLFELLYGQPPFGALPAENSRDLVAGRLLDRQQRGPTLPKNRSGDADRRIGDIIVRCLAFDPAQRPQTMGEVATLLAAELKTSRRAGRWLRVHRRLVIGAASLACAAVMAVAGWQVTRDPYPIRELRQGKAAYDRGDDAAAVLHLDEALRHDPKLSDARYLRALAHSHQKDYIAACADLDRLCTEVPDGRARAALAYVLAVLRSDDVMAIAHYEKSIKEGFSAAEVYNNLGYCLSRRAKLAEAAQALREAIALDPELGAAHHNLARNQFRLAFQEQRAPSTTEIDEALWLCPATAELYLEAARIYAFRSTFAKDDKTYDEDLDRVFRYLREGLQLGLNQKHLQEIAGLNLDLTSDRRWKSLESEVQPGATYTRAALLIEPQPGFRFQKGSLAPAVARR